VLVITKNVVAYDNDFSHPYINEKAVVEISSVNTIYKTSLGFKEGINTKIDGKEIWKWIRDGGKYEDDPGWRCLRHFHDPLNSNWDNAGLLSLYHSMLYWAQTPEPSNPFGLFNEYSWALARKYYHQALLTGSEEQYAKTFRSVGQLMHLVSDAAVPAHVRNDAHLKMDIKGITIIDDSDPYENWAQALLSGSFSTPSIEFENYTVNPAIFNKAVHNSMAPSPISALWDHDEYIHGSNMPSDSNATIGLAEYTNANFWTEDTFPWKSMSDSYPHPVLEDTNFFEVWLNPESIDAEDGVSDNRIYLSKKSDPSGAPFLSAGYWLYQLYMWNKPELKYAFSLDEKCYEQFAKKLIPRAIGYSAALLDYFFRGQLYVSAMPYFENNVLKYITLNIENITETQESMAEGSFFLLFKYTPKDGNPDGSEDVYVLAKQTAPVETLAYNESVELHFESSEPIPLECWNSVQCTLGFRGILGNEADAVVGKVFNPGKILFNEEWDNGLFGNNNWQDWGDNDDYAKKTVAGGLLTMESSTNPEYASSGRWNSIAVEFKTVDNDGLLITPTTHLQFIIPKMESSLGNPIGANHALALHFSDGTIIEYSGDGRLCNWTNIDRLIPLTFDLDTIITENIHERYSYSNRPIPDPLHLEAIQLMQTAIFETMNDYYFYMDVDAIRLFDTKSKE
jgi:hypothetical protein